MSAFDIAGRLILDTGNYVAGLAKAQDKTSHFKSMMKGGLIAAAGAATTALAATGLAITNTINNADEMAKAASKFGVPIEELSRLKYAGDLSDVSLEQLGGSLKKLTMNMSEAAAGSKTQAEAFAAAGIAIANQDGTLRSSSDVLADLADKFAGMPDGAEKTALAMELMGKSGTNMIPLLNGGAEALAEMKAEADTFGQVFTQEMGDNAQTFNDNITRLQGAFGNMAAELTEKLLPYLVQFTDWMVDNAPAVAENVAKFFEFAVAIGKLVAAVYEVIEPLLELQMILTEKMVQALTEVATVVAEVIPKFIQIGRDIVAGLLKGLQEKWQAVKDWVGGATSWIASAFTRENEIQSPSRVFMRIGNFMMEGLGLGLAEGYETVKADATEYARGISDTFNSGINMSVGVPGMDGTNISKPTDDFTNKMVEGTTMIQDVTQKAFASMSDAFTEFVTKGKVDFKSLADSMIADMARMASQKLFESLFGTIFDGIGGALGGGGAAPAPAYYNGGIVDRGPALPSWDGNVFRTPQKFFANGGLATMAEKGAEAIMPLARNSRGQLGVYADGGGGGGNVYNFNTNVTVDGAGGQDGNELGVKVAAQIDKMLDYKIHKAMAQDKNTRGGMNRR